METSPAGHRVIGIRHVLKTLKEAGLVEQEALYARDAVSNVQDELLNKAATWYLVGSKRGALEVLDAFLDGRLTLKKKPDGSREVIASVDELSWSRRLNVTVGNSKKSVRKRTYSLSTTELGFE